MVMLHPLVPGVVCSRVGGRGAARASILGVLQADAPEQDSKGGFIDGALAKVSSNRTAIHSWINCI